MENNYYTLKDFKNNNENSRASKISKRRQRRRKRKQTKGEKVQSTYASLNASKVNKNNRKLNYKKVFICLAILVAIFYIIISNIVKAFSSGKETKIASANVLADSKKTTVNMAVIGDIMCHSTNFKDAYDSNKNIYDFSKVFTEIKSYTKSADITIGNLETTFSGKSRGYSGYPNFNTPEQLADDLKEIGVDVVSTANNHSLDKGYSGLVNTLDVLDKAGIQHTGTYKSEKEQETILIKEVNGIKFAFLSFTYGTNGINVPSGKEYCINLIDKDLIINQLDKAKELTPDVICVSMHWGEEYKIKANYTQEKWADFLFENGVDIILGTHPHVLEKMEKRTIELQDGSTKEGFVIYSLGNFMSGQKADNTMNSIILKLQINKDENNKISITPDHIPIYMWDKGEDQKERYKILDINKWISAYETGTESISKNLYNTLVESREKINGILNDKI